MRPQALVPAAALLLCALAASPASAGRFEDQLMVELNNVRAHPQAYARELRREALVEARYGDPYTDSAAQEDPAAVEDAIDFLMRQPPLGPLRADPRLAAAAREHVARQGPRGDVGHGEPGSLGRRLQGEGVFAGLTAENISYGQNSPKDVIRQLVIDSRVPSRGHRKNIFGQAYTAAGVACGPHAEWGSMCVIDFAGAIMRR